MTVMSRNRRNRPKQAKAQTKHGNKPDQHNHRSPLRKAIPVSHPKDRSEEDHDKNKPHAVKTFLERYATALFTGLLVIVGIVAIVVSAIPGRANIVLIKMHGQFPPAIGEPITLSFDFGNVGQNTGITIDKCNVFLVWKAGGAMPDSPLYEDAPCPGGTKDRASLYPPGKTLPGTMDQLIGRDGKPIIFTREIGDAIQAGTAIAYEFGFIKYRDRYSRFLGDMRTGYCFRYIGGGAWRNCGMPNYEYQN